MNTSVMKTFCDLVQGGSFSRAAEMNNVSQSAVSQQLAKLEAAYATQLLSRSGGLIAPTEAGKALYRGSRDILDRYEKMGEQIKSAALGRGGSLRVGTIYSVGLYILQPFIRKYIKAYPKINLEVEYTDWITITESVLGGEMDIGVVAYPEKHRSLQATFLTGEQLIMVCSPSHRLAGKMSVTPQDLEGEKVVAFVRGIPTRRAIDRTLRRAGVHVDIVAEFDNIDTLKRAVEVDAGVSILPKNTVERELTMRMLAGVPFSDQARWIRNISLLRRRGGPRTRAQRLFVEVLRSG